MLDKEIDNFLLLPVAGCEQRCSPCLILHIDVYSPLEKEIYKDDASGEYLLFCQTGHAVLIGDLDCFHEEVKTVHGNLNVDVHIVLPIMLNEVFHSDSFEELESLLVSISWVVVRVEVPFDFLVYGVESGIDKH